MRTGACLSEVVHDISTHHAHDSPNSLTPVRTVTNRREMSCDEVCDKGASSECRCEPGPETFAHMSMKVPKKLAVWGRRFFIGGTRQGQLAKRVNTCRRDLSRPWYAYCVEGSVRNGKLTVDIACADELQSTLVLFRTIALLLIYFS